MSTGPAGVAADKGSENADASDVTDPLSDGVSPWDLEYLVRARGECRVGMSPSELASFFPADRVVPAMLDMMGELFGLEISEVADASVWYPDVTLFVVADRRAAICSAMCTWTCSPGTASSAMHKPAR